jgi:hypothetical protein
VKRIFDIALGEIAPMSRACAVDRPKAVQQFAGVFGTALHCSTHVVFASGMPAKRAVFRRARVGCQARNCFRIFQQPIVVPDLILWTIAFGLFESFTLRMIVASQRRVGIRKIVTQAT